MPLIQNENMKIYRRAVTWVMIGIVVAINLIVALVLFNLESSQGMGVIDFIGASSDIVGFVIFFTVVIAASIVSSEFSWGTIKLLLIRPVSRTKILLSKYIATLIFAIVLILTVFISSIIFGLIFFGFGGGEDLTTWGILKTYSNDLVDIVMTVTFAFMISVVLRSNALAISLTYIIYFLSATVMGILSALDLNWGKYILFANTNFSQYAEQPGGFVREPLFEGMSLGFSITIVIAYFIVFNLISWVTFIKRDVSI